MQQYQSNIKRNYYFYNPNVLLFFVRLFDFADRS